MDKGTVSNCVSACLLAAGLALDFAGHGGALQSAVLSVGLFAFSGGITNSLAIKMLFDRVPGFYGSGVIQLRFEEIREQIKKLILEQFFTAEHLREYFRAQERRVDVMEFLRARDGRSPLRALVETQWTKLTSADVLGRIVSEHVERAFNSTMGGLLVLVGRETIEGVVGRFVASLAESMRSRLEELADEVTLDARSLGLEVDEQRIIERLKEEVRSLLERRLEKLTPQQVKRIVEDVIRRHLGWLVIWGNVFGGGIGLIAWWCNW
jgi:uncharacterized membrane protein YheB (UPF0754 family)